MEKYIPVDPLDSAEGCFHIRSSPDMKKWEIQVFQHFALIDTGCALGGEDDKKMHQLTRGGEAPSVPGEIGGVVPAQGAGVLTVVHNPIVGTSETERVMALQAHAVAVDGLVAHRAFHRSS